MLPPETFVERMDQLITSVKDSRRAPGQEIVVPGELENRAATTAAGIVALPAMTVIKLNALAAKRQIAPLVPAD
jgi:LDH2 family malate/lactate/ureidoglycolate dehydrogenase